MARITHVLPADAGVCRSTLTTTEFPSAAARAAVAAALAEDASGKDITTEWSVPEDLAATAEIRTRQSGVAAGLPVVTEVFAQVDPEVKVEPAIADGTRLADGQVLVHLSGPAQKGVEAACPGGSAGDLEPYAGSVTPAQR